VSGFTAERLRVLGVEPSRVLVVYNGVDTAFFRPPDSEKTRAVREKLAGDKPFVLITVSRLDSRKNHLGVIRALAQLRDTNPELVDDTVYLVCGSGPMEPAITAEINRRGLLDTVRLAGYVGQDELTAYYAAADAVIMPVVLEEDVGSVEGFGLTFLEAAACGTPAIAGKAGGVPDAVADGQTGIHVDGTRDSEIARAIRLLYENAELRSRMAERAYQRATNEFELRNVFRRELQQIESLLHASSGKETHNG
jgi:phosphatidylinositol alpha-1,6-mannosyltransferase